MEPFKPLHQSITEPDEAELVDRVFAHTGYRSTLLNLQNMPTAPGWLTREPLLEMPGQPKGDVDVLLVEPGRVDEATAIEVKRFKVVIEEGGFGVVNKLGEFRKGVQQANALAAIGFAQVYLLILIVVDSRPAHAGTISYRGSTAQAKSVVRQAVSIQHLDPRVGLLLYEVAQPMDHRPLTVGSGGFHLERLATIVPQTSVVSDWIRTRVSRLTFPRTIALS